VPGWDGAGVSTIPYDVATLAVPEIIADPYPAYAALRDRSPLPGYVDYPPGTVPGVDEPVTAWALLSHEQVTAAARDHRTFSSRDPVQEASEAPSLMLVNTDQPRHTAHRKVVSKAFTRSRVAALRPYLQEKVGALVATITPGEELEVVHDICAALPAIVMCRFFGAPDTDAPSYERWANAFMLSSDLSGEERNASNLEMAGYFVELVGGRAQTLAAGREPSDDLVDALLAAEAEGERLTVEEVIRLCITLVVAGSETSMYFAANVVDALLEYPGETARLRTDRSRLTAFLNESLRLSGPPQRLFRIATCDVEVGGKLIREGDWVALFFAAANHDPLVFPDPDVFDPDRANAGKHLTFGLGIHYCLGAPLAMLELECLVDVLLDRFARLERGPSPRVPQTATMLQHSFSSIPVVFHEE
jgi:cytochrome P450